MAPVQVTQWMTKNYPRPRVDPEWLDSCSEYVLETLSLSPANAIDLPRILENIEAQYLNSDLRDSTVPSSGLPEQLLTGANAQTLSGNAVLVEIAAITEIGSSAFQLQNVRQMRIDRADLAGMNAERGEDGEHEEDEEGPVPRYPRSMLSLELCDGTHTFKAIEFKRIPTLLLGETPLGYKLLLKNVTFRNGIAMLEPNNVVIKGYLTQDREDQQDIEFVHGLRRRMGLPAEAEDVDMAQAAAVVANNRALASVPVPAPARPRAASPDDIDDFFNDEDAFMNAPAPPARKPKQAVAKPGSKATTTSTKAPPSKVGQGSQAAARPKSSATVEQQPPLFMPSPSPEPAHVSDSDFGFGDDTFEDDDLAALDAIEQQAVATLRPSASSASHPTSSYSSSRTRASRSTSAPDSDVMTIDSDSDQDNEPPPPPPSQWQRRSRATPSSGMKATCSGSRSMSTKPHDISADIIEVSD